MSVLPLFFTTLGQRITVRSGNISHPGGFLAGSREGHN